jgi:hypothetical protein
MYENTTSRTTATAGGAGARRVTSTIAGVLSTAGAFAMVIALGAGPASAIPVPDDAGGQYLACMRHLGGSADRLEHWAGACRGQGSVADPAERAYVECLRATAGTADGLDRRTQSCRALTR